MHAREETMHAGDALGLPRCRVLERPEDEVLLEEALGASGWNRSQAARKLGINRLTLRRKLDEYGIGGKTGHIEPD